MANRTEPSLLHDDILEPLHWQERTWSGIATTCAGDVELSIFGGSNELPTWARKLVVEALHRVEKLVIEANAFLIRGLSAKELALGPYKFAANAISTGAVWQQKQNSFTLWLQLDGDPDGVWRVEFGPDGPLDSGRDS